MALVDGTSKANIGGRGEMRERLRALDWSKTPLGPIEAWSPSLRTAADIVLASPVAMVLMWGQDGVLIYNDAYAAFAGDRHPAVFGVGAREAWPEISEHNDRLIRQVLGGETVSLRDQELTLDRRGTLEPVWMDLDYSPVHDEAGKPAGVLVVVMETTDRILATRELMTASERLELALSASAGVGTWDWDVDQDRVVADARFARLYGVDPALARAGAPLDEFFRAIHPEDATRVQREIAQALESGDLFRSEYRLVEPNGETRWVTAEGRTITAGDGKSRRFPGVTYDVTARVRETERQAALIALDDALAEIEDPLEIASASSRILGQVLDAARVGYGRIDAETRTIEIDRDWTAAGMSSVVGHHSFDSYGDYVADLLAGEAVRIADVATDSRVPNPEPLRQYGVAAFMDVPLMEAGRATAQILVHSSTPRTWTDADVAYVRVFAERTRAAVERRRAEAAALNSDERYRTLFETIDEGFCLIEMKFDAKQRPVDYMIVEGNAAFESLTGLKDANGKWVSEIAPGLEQHWFDLYGRVALTGESVRFENPADIFGRWYDVHAMRVGTPDQHRVAVLFNNITERKRAERRQSALLAFNERILLARDSAEAGLIAAETLAERLGGARAGYGLVDLEAETVSYQTEWHRADAISPARTANLRTYGDFVDDLRNGLTVIAPDIERHPRTQGDRDAYRARGVAAFAVVPIMQRGELSAMITVASPEVQDWSGADIEFMEEVAARAAITIDRLRTEEALRASEERYRTLFETMDEGFCVIEFIDGPQGPLSDYVHVEANPAYAANAGIPDVVGKRLRELVGDEADHWLERYRHVLDTGEPIRFEQELEETGRWLELAAFRLEPSSRNQVAVLFKDLTARRQAEQAVRESEVRFRNMADNTPMMMWVTDPDGFCTYLNKTWYEFTGQTEAEAEGFGWLDATHPDDKARTEEAFVSANDARAPFRVEYRLRRADGVYRWAIDAASPRFDENGAYLGYVGSVIDIDERREAENALRASEAQFRAFAQAVPNQIWAARPNGELYWFNEQVYAYTGQLPGGLDGMTGWATIVHPDDLAQAAAAWQRSLETGDIYDTEFRIRRADGAWRWFAVRAEPVIDADGTITQWVGANLDIDLIKRQAEELARLNATLEERIIEAVAGRQVLADVVESVDAFVQVIDRDFRWMAVNRAASDEYESVFGARPQIGESLKDTLAHLPEEVARFDVIWRRALSGESVHEIMDVGDPDRRRNPHEIRLYPLRDADGEVIGAFKFGYDVSDRLAEQARLREAEEALRQSQKMEAVGQLTGGIAHDFNNLLAGISGSLELLNKRLAEGRTQGLERYITAAQGASQRAAALTQRLLAFSRRQTLDPRPTDVNRLIHGMEELIRRSVGPDVEVEVVGAGGLWPSRIDQSQLENALLNLCINARDAMAPDGGRLVIETANKWLDERAARERDLQPGQYISLCVTDTGTGMTPELIEKIFDPFFTTKPLGQGTGLGLSMIHGFVRQSGGQVRVYSEVGEGTTMCLYLPRHVGSLEDAEPLMDIGHEGQGHGETILVIDDEPTVRMLVAEVLGEAGYSVIEAQDGPTGLRILETDVKIDLLVTDVGLPGGMNGRQVADAARVSRPGLRVLFITGYAENAAVGNGLLEPGMEVITKPFVMTELAAKVTEMVEGPPGIA